MSLKSGGHTRQDSVTNANYSTDRIYLTREGWCDDHRGDRAPDVLDLGDGQATTAMSSSEATGHHAKTASLETKSGESKSSQVTILWDSNVASIYFKCFK